MFFNPQLLRLVSFFFNKFPVFIQSNWWLSFKISFQRESFNLYIQEKNGFLLIISFSTLNPKFCQSKSSMGVKRALRSSSSKFFETSNPKTNKPLLGGNENTSIEERWVIPSFLRDNLFDESFDWESLPYSADPPYTGCRGPGDLLTIDLDLKHVPRLGTCRGDFSLSTDVVFKSYTYIYKGWRSQC